MDVPRTGRREGTAEQGHQNGEPRANSEPSVLWVNEDQIFSIPKGQVRQQDGAAPERDAP